VEQFNSYFINVGASLDKKIQNTHIKPDSYISQSVTNTIFFSPVIEDEVISIIKNMKNSSPGWDSIPPSLLKKTYIEFVKPLTHTLNLSIIQGIFPEELKIAKVIPIYKAGDQSTFSNYRPVSVLPSFSKIFEKIMYDRIMSFINKNQLLYDYQFGFRKNRSTSMALIKLLDNITNALDNGECVLGVFLDFSKAFDTVNFKILFMKLKHYGFRGQPLELMKSYLSNRKQYVSFSDANSRKQIIKCGVPQGSILGPILFLLYINDMATVSKAIFPLLFADDTNVFINGKDIDVLMKNMNIELGKLIVWLQCNRLSLNIKKKHFMIFKSKRKKINRPLIPLQMNSEYLQEVTYTKFLGIIIDNELSWSQHINYIKGKIAKGIGIIGKAKHLLNQETLKTLYYSFVYPYLNYCIIVWGNTYNKYVDELFKLQKKVVRIITGSHYLEHTKELFRTLYILPIRKILLYNISQFMYRYIEGTLPDIFNDMFSFNRAYHSYNTRSANLLSVPKHNLNVRSFSIKVTGVRVWNLLTSYNLHICKSLEIFKRNVKIFLNSNDINLF
jgi:hypothetical protein